MNLSWFEYNKYKAEKAEKMKYHRWENCDRRTLDEKSLKGFRSFDYKKCKKCGLEKITVALTKNIYGRNDFTTLYFRSKFGKFVKGGWDWKDKVPFSCRKSVKIDINKIVGEDFLDIKI